MKREILIITNDLLRGGAQRILTDIVKASDPARFSYTIAYFNQSSDMTDTLADTLVEAGGTLRYIGGTGSLAKLHALYSLMRTERPTVAVAFLPYSCILTRIAGVFAGIPTVSVQCNLPFTYPPFLRTLDARTLPLARAWFGASSGIEAAYGGSSAPFTREAWDTGRRHFTRYGAVDVDHIYAEAHAADPAEVRAEFAIPAAAPLIVMVARLITWKGHEDLIDALVSYPEAHALVVGWGPQEAELKQRAQDKGVTDRIHFAGRRTDVYRLLGAADCYVQAHRSAGNHTWEGPNLSQMEACAAGVPSVSTAVPRIEELIEEGVTGRLARIDDPEDLARALRDSIEDQAASKRMALAARSRTEERFGLRGMVQDYEGLFDAIAG